MDTIILLGFLCIGLAWMLQAAKNQTKWSGFTMLLFALVGLQLVGAGFGDAELGRKVTGLGTAYLAFTWLTAQWIRSKWGIILPLLGTLSYFLLSGVSLEYHGYRVIFDPANVLLLPVIGAVIPYLAAWKSRWVYKLIGLDQADTAQMVGAFSVGILLVVAFVFGQSYGMILVGIGALGTYFHLRTGYDHRFRTVFALWLIPLAAHVLQTEDISLASLTHGAVLIGLFIGAATGLWIFLWSRSERASLGGLLWMLLVSFLVSSFIVFSEKLKEHTGGMSAWLAMMVAFALVFPFLPKRGENLAGGYVSFLLSFGLLVAPLFQSPLDELPVNTKIPTCGDTSNKSSSKDPLNVSGLSLDAHAGAWKLVSEQSKITFELGPEGTRTKGFFKTFSADLNVDPALSGNQLSVTLSVKSLSTFNDYRDNSLMSELYFDEAKFPAISFRSTRWEKQGDLYRVIGDFTMKGKTQEMTIEMKVAATGSEKGKDYLILVGKSSVDRTNHGMESDPKIGDVVDFQFEVEFTR